MCPRKLGTEKSIQYVVCSKSRFMYKVIHAECRIFTLTEVAHFSAMFCTFDWSLLKYK
jgi:hypothetical protein